MAHSEHMGRDNEGEGGGSGGEGALLLNYGVWGRDVNWKKLLLATCVAWRQGEHWAYEV